MQFFTIFKHRHAVDLSSRFVATKFYVENQRSDERKNQETKNESLSTRSTSLAKYRYPWNFCFDFCTQFFPRFAFGSLVDSIPIRHVSSVKMTIRLVKWKNREKVNAKIDSLACVDCTQSNVRHSHFISFFPFTQNLQSEKFILYKIDWSFCHRYRVFVSDRENAIDSIDFESNRVIQKTCSIRSTAVKETTRKPLSWIELNSSALLHRTHVVVSLWTFHASLQLNRSPKKHCISL